MKKPLPGCESSASHAWLGKARHGAAWRVRSRQGMGGWQAPRFESSASTRGTARQCSAGSGRARPGTARLGGSGSGSARRGWSGRGAHIRVRVPDAHARHGLAWSGTAGSGESGRGAAWRGLARRGWAGQVEAGRGLARHGNHSHLCIGFARREEMQSGRMVLPGFDSPALTHGWAWHGIGWARQGSAGCGAVLQGRARHGAGDKQTREVRVLGAHARHGPARHGSVLQGAAWQGRNGCGWAWHGAVWHRWARQALVWLGVACQGAAGNPPLSRSESV